MTREKNTEPLPTVVMSLKLSLGWRDYGQRLPDLMRPEFGILAC